MLSLAGDRKRCLTTHAAPVGTSEDYVASYRDIRNDVQVHNLERQMNHTNKDMARLNSLISSNQNTAASLEDKYFHLQQSVMSELKDQEAEAKKLESDVDQCSAKKKELLSEVLETEREIMLWERKLQLDREMRELLDPTVGQVKITIDPYIE